METENELFNILIKTGALLKGHFKLSSGLHSDTYIQCALALKYPEYALTFAKELYLRTREYNPQIIVSPALGGIIIGWEVAEQFNVPFIFSEREDGVMKLRRGFSIEKGERILIVEDVFTTGKSTMEVFDLVKGYGGVVVGACSIVKRGSFSFPFPSISLINIELQTYQPDQCPLCKSGITLVKPGSRK